MSEHSTEYSNHGHDVDDHDDDLGDHHPHHQFHSHESASAFAGLFDRDSRKQRAIQERKYRAKREKYEEEKQRMLHRTGYDLSLKTIKTGLLKVRNQLRSWVKFYCELRHGMLIMYKEDKHDAWMDTILLSGGLVIERPSRKEGFTFKFSHPLKQSIHAPRGPRGELWINLLRMPSDHCIFRVATAEECDEWIAAFKHAIYGAHPAYDELMTGAITTGLVDDDDDLVARSPLSRLGTSGPAGARGRAGSGGDLAPSLEQPSALSLSLQKRLRAAGTQQAENEDKDQDDADDVVPQPRSSPPAEYSPPAPPVAVDETEWVPTAPLISDDDTAPAQVLSDETRNRLWAIAAKLDVGASLPVPIELRQPQSELQRLSDLFLHADFITDAAKHKLPRCRVVCVLRWAVSALCNRPAGMAVPLPAAPGEVFRCHFECPQHSATPPTRAFFVAELVDSSNHTVAFELTNRQAGWRVLGSLAPTTKFFGNTITHEYHGTISVRLDHFGETYSVQLPKRVTRGVINGRTSTCLQGALKVACAATGLSCTMHVDTHVRGSVTGRVTDAETDGLTISGSWSGGIHIARGETQQLLLACTSAELRARRLSKRVVAPSHLWTQASTDVDVTDSQVLWAAVQRALLQSSIGAAQAAYDRIIRTAAQQSNDRYYSKFFAPQSDGWLCTTTIDRAWDYGQDVYEYQQQGELKVLTVDDAGLQISGDTASPPTLRRRHASVHTDTDSHAAVDVAAYTRARAPTYATSPMSKAVTPVTPGDLTAAAASLPSNTWEREVQALEQRMLTVERMLARERLTLLTCILLFLLVLLLRSWSWSWPW
ncbi:hypothetical protein PTSG_12933 [Salpingoeca rosetta]|uniref:PH domain-containing protein n=1 Tax=Salpingoeca rosetta (strain ATCC 50818 / BSB-021) TaxID=946362 RepID=F2UNA9_SALR5|nr:uncharacterized protein PTSG_12933 [Salpingoeca rosetta]EGD79114.1 hypothetical protein PTSG_12933 [Salpingoeca rosetta]|eukprot:XP_004989199.1 hypothetical protein PTSG_12933 [Salpingoeca rosetta]